MRVQGNAPWVKRSPSIAHALFFVMCTFPEGKVAHDATLLLYGKKKRTQLMMTVTFFQKALVKRTRGRSSHDSSIAAYTHCRSITIGP